MIVTLAARSGGGRLAVRRQLRPSGCFGGFHRLQNHAGGGIRRPGRVTRVGKLEELIVTSLARLELVVGRAAPALIVGTVGPVTMLAVMAWRLAVQMRGSLWLLGGLVLLAAGASYFKPWLE